MSKNTSENISENITVAKRPKICVPIVSPQRDGVVRAAKNAAGLPVEMVEWRVDFFAGYEREIPGAIEELKRILGGKELIVTLRTEAEGGEKNGSRFDYFSLVETVLEQGAADHVDVEISRDPGKIRELAGRFRGGRTKLIGSYHDFSSTPSEEFILGRLTEAKELGCDIGKFACMPSCPDDVERLLRATGEMKKRYPDYPLITMSMGEMGKKSRLYGGLYGSFVTFGTAGEASAPGQVPCEEMASLFDRLYSGKKHIFLIGFMGAGKSTVSRELKNRYGWREIDTDAEIVEREGRSIADIFSEEGEEYFRDVETGLLDELGGGETAVISCGGGMALRELNVKKMRAIGRVVLLTAEPETIYERVRHSSSRPILNGNMNVEYIAGLMEKRRPHYEGAAEYHVATDGRGAEEIAEEILRLVSGN